MSGEVLEAVIGMLKPTLKGEVWVTERGGCPRAETEKGKAMGMKSHDATLMKHWNGKQFDDSHFLCMECGLNYNVNGSLKQCEQNKTPCRFQPAPTTKDRSGD